MLSALMLVMFWVPQNAGERVTGIVTMLLAFTVFLHMVSDIVPRTSLQIPVLGKQSKIMRYCKFHLLLILLYSHPPDEYHVPGNVISVSNDFAHEYVSQ